MQIFAKCGPSASRGDQASMFTGNPSFKVNKFILPATGDGVSDICLKWVDQKKNNSIKRLCPVGFEPTHPKIIAPKAIALTNSAKGTL